MMIGGVRHGGCANGCSLDATGLPTAPVKESTVSGVAGAWQYLRAGLSSWGDLRRQRALLSPPVNTPGAKYGRICALILPHPGRRCGTTGGLIDERQVLW
jgi:hypothetical protein